MKLKISWKIIFTIKIIVHVCDYQNKIGLKYELREKSRSINYKWEYFWVVAAAAAVSIDTVIWSEHTTVNSQSSTAIQIELSEWAASSQTIHKVQQYIFYGNYVYTLNAWNATTKTTTTTIEFNGKYLYYVWFVFVLKFVFIPWTFCNGIKWFSFYLLWMSELLLNFCRFGGFSGSCSSSM